MFLSRLPIDTGGNPNRPRPGHLWLRNLYHVHQRLCMAFPSDPQRSRDPDFLKPFNPAEFGHNQVHVERREDSGFLFRIDPESPGRAVILLQSSRKPDWEYAFHNAGYLLAAPPLVKPFQPRFTTGQRLHFRLVANPTRKIATIKKQERQSHSKDELKEIKGRHGKRVPVRDEQLIDWLAGRAQKSGFSFDPERTLLQPGYIYVKKPTEAQGTRLRSVRYEGILEVNDVDLFYKTLIRGIGTGKAFGFGLLSVAPAALPLPGARP